MGTTGRAGSTDKAGIQVGIQDVFDKFDPNVKLAAKEIEVMGDFAYGVGNVHLKLTPKVRRRRSARQLVWLLVKHEGSWNIKRQIWNKKPIG